MGPTDEGDARKSIPAHQSRLELWLEQSIILFAKSMVALGFVAAVYGSLVASFFYCCGTDGWEFANPSKSPLGAVVTVLLVWPVVGLLCLLLQDGLGEILKAVGRRSKGLASALRRGR